MRAVFIDRDGTINRDNDYVHKVADFHFLPGVIEALRRLQDAGFATIITTNQSGVGRGYYTEEDYREVMAHMEQELAKHGVNLTGVYQCFHHAEGNHPYRCSCDCRKPGPGMVLTAKQERGIELARSFVVGDKWVDVRMGLNAGLPREHCILVRTGKAGFDIQNKADGTPIVDDLPAAVDYILGKS